MFTGIVRATAEVRKAETRAGNRVVSVASPRGWKFTNGASVAVDGICSTIVRSGRGAFEVVYMPETLRLTTAKDFAVGRVVNLEPPLSLGGTLDGHFVQGHVDGGLKKYPHYKINYPRQFSQEQITKLEAGIRHTDAKTHIRKFFKMITVFINKFAMLNV